MKTLPLIALLLAGCTVQMRPGLGDPEPYSRAESDAILTNAECKRLARTMVEIARCDVDRR